MLNAGSDDGEVDDGLSALEVLENRAGGLIEPVRWSAVVVHEVNATGARLVHAERPDTRGRQCDLPVLSGKTTLARELGELPGLPVIHIDAQYWREVDGKRAEPTPQQWADHHRQLIAGNRWIIDGMKLGVLPERLAAADTVIYLDVSTLACLSGGSAAPNPLPRPAAAGPGDL
jgi:hypothetical protein